MKVYPSEIPVLAIAGGIAAFALYVALEIPAYWYPKRIEWVDRFIYFALFLLPVALYVAASIAIGRVAHTWYKRSRAGWCWLSIIFTPPVARIFLWVADVPHSAVVAEEKAEEARRRREGHPDWPEEKAMLASDAACPSCGALVNAETGEGVAERDPDKPWLVRCARCRADVTVKS